MHIDLFAPRRGRPAPIDLIEVGDCWEWQGNRSLEYGYGRVGYGGRVHLAHRLFYEALVGPIPEGLQLDHLCRNPPCVNPDHLEPVTMQENIRRGAPGAWEGRKRQTHCKNGHPFDGGTPGHRRCSICRRSITQRYEAKRRERR
jgi:hypothetical protein